MSVEPEPQIYTDRPIKSADRDLFGFREGLVPRLARVAVDWPSSQGLVVGLFGPWGSGKTSALNLLAEHLRSTTDDKIRIARFNPWSYDDQGALIASFFGTVAYGVGKDDEPSAAKAKRALRGMGTFLSVASRGLTVAGVAFDASMIGEGAKAASEVLRGAAGVTDDLAAIAELRSQGERTLDVHRAQLEEALEEIGREGGRILILLDDIDRLDREELLGLLRLIRTAADLPAVTVVVAMDDARVRDILERSAERGYGRDYLEKIVQVPVHLPLPTHDQVGRQLEELLAQVFKEAGVRHPAELTRHEWRILRGDYDLLLSTIRTPRDLARYLNALRTLLLAGADPDVDPFDAAFLEALHVFHPDVYDRLRREKDFLTRSSDNREDFQERLLSRRDSSATEKTAARRRERLTRIVNGSDETRGPVEEERIRRILHLLFGDVEGGPVESDSEADAAKRRIRSPHAFDNYFRFGPVAGTISRIETDAIAEDLRLAASGGDEAAVAAILTDALAERPPHASDRFVGDLLPRLKEIPRAELPVLARGAVRASNSLPEEVLLGRFRRILGAVPWPRSTTGDEEDTDQEVAAEVLEAGIEGLHPFDSWSLVAADDLRWLNQEVHRRTRAAWLTRLAGVLEVGDYLDREAPAWDLLQAFNGARKYIDELGESSPLSHPDLQTLLVGYAERLPARAPILLFAVAISMGGGLPQLADARHQPLAVTKQLLERNYGSVGALGTALEEYRRSSEPIPELDSLVDEYLSLLRMEEGAATQNAEGSGEDGEITA